MNDFDYTQLRRDMKKDIIQDKDTGLKEQYVIGWMMIDEINKVQEHHGQFTFRGKMLPIYETPYYMGDMRKVLIKVTTEVK